MRPAQQLTAALQLLQHDHTSPGHRASRSATVMPTGMTPRATVHVRQSSRRAAHHAVQVICRPATAPRAARPSCQPTHGRTRAWLDKYMYSDDFASQKRRSRTCGPHGQVTRGYTRRRMANRFSQNESGTHFSPPTAKRQKQTPHIGRTAPLTTAESH